MACLTCFCSESGMILMVKASDRSLVMENTALMTLKATRTWGESEVAGKSAVVTSCHWKNRRLLWAECQDVTWLLIGLEPETEFCQFQMKNILALISETHALTTFINRRRTELITARELKSQLKRNIHLNRMIDFLVLGFSTPTKEIFLDVTGFQDSSFAGSEFFDQSILMQFAEDVGAIGCFLVHAHGVLISMSDTTQLISKIQKSIILLLVQHAETPIEIHLGGETKYIYTFQCHPEIKLIGIMETENREKWMQSGLKFCRKHEKIFQLFEEQERISSSDFFIRAEIQGFLVLCKKSKRCWSSVRPKWDQTEDNHRTAFRRIQMLRQIFGRLEDKLSDDGDVENYEINRGYASYATEQSEFQVLVLFRPEVSISTLITIGRNFVAFTMQKLNTSMI